MGLRDNAGTPRQIIVASVPYNAHADCDISQILHEWETEFMPTSGAPVPKMTKVVPSAKNIDLAVNPDQAALIALAAASPVDLPHGFVTNGFVTYMGPGRIKCGEYSQGNGKLPIEILWTTAPTKV